MMMQLVFWTLILGIGGSALIMALRIAVQVLLNLKFYLAINSAIWAEAAADKLTDWIIQGSGLAFALFLSVIRRAFRSLGFAARPAKKKQEHGPRWRPPEAADPMREARDILGLHYEFSAADLKARHRELMKRVHTDAGGTDWLSQRVNWAHDTLKKAAR